MSFLAIWLFGISMHGGATFDIEANQATFDLVSLLSLRPPNLKAFPNYLKLIESWDGVG